MLVPQIAWSRDFHDLVAILGTTISPYLFFWQASQEAEDMRHAEPLTKRAAQAGADAFERIRARYLDRHGVLQPDCACDHHHATATLKQPA